MADIRFENVSKYFPGGVEIVKNLNLHIRDGEFLVLVGPSGCGKSTILRMIAGLESVSGGKLQIANRVVNDVAPKDRDIAMVFQSYALYPHMTVADNIGFPLRVSGMPASEIKRQVAEAARILELTDQLEKRPAQLSGGQRQRVAMGRAIVRHPAVFLLDEPLSNLDAKLRNQTRAEIVELQSRLGVTTVYVTHDQVEAMTMGHRVAVLRDGVLQQLGTPKELYLKPANIFVAGFIGAPGMNLIDAEIEGGQVRLGGNLLALPSDVKAGLDNAGSARITVGVRPENVRLSEHGVSGVIRGVEEMGAEAIARIEIQHNGKQTVLLSRIEGHGDRRKGDRVFVDLTENIHLFAENGGRLSA